MFFTWRHYSLRKTRVVGYIVHGDENLMTTDTPVWGHATKKSIFMAVEY